MAFFLGQNISPLIKVQFAETDGRQVAVLEVEKHHEPVFMHEGDTTYFLVRDGNATKRLAPLDQHAYVQNHQAFKNSETTDASELKIQAIEQRQQDLERRQETFELRHLSITKGDFPDSLIHQQDNDTPAEHRISYRHPTWLKVATKKVLNVFLEQLSKNQDWNKVHIISPWISAFDEGASIRFSTFIERLALYNTTLYVTTRPPTDDWHEDAIQQIKKTGRANVSLVKNLHTKLYIADTRKGSFAFLGSANFTQQSFKSHELGMLVNNYGRGKPVVHNLKQQAMSIYRTKGRTLDCKAQLR